MIHFSAKKPVAIFAISIGIVILGVISYSKIPINLMPEMKIPEFKIISTWPTGTTEEVEEQITTPLERALSTTPGLKSSSSQTVKGKSEIKLTFQSHIEIPQTISEIRDRIDGASLPDGISKPQVKRFQSEKNTVMELVITSERTSQGESLKILQNQLNDTLINPLESMEGVALVQIKGLPETYQLLKVNTTALSAFNLSTQAIVDALNQFDRSIQAGQIEINGKLVPIRISNHLKSLEEILNIGIPSAQQKMIRLRDLVEIHPQESNFQPVHYQGTPALHLEIIKEAEANTVEVGRRVRIFLNSLPGSNEYKMTTLRDQSSEIENAVDNVRGSVVSGAILAALIIYLLLRSPWTSFVITICIPISLLITLILMYFSGISFNLMSLAGLALGVGMLVDNSTVVLESIAEQALITADPIQSSISGAQKVFGAITASTFSTIAVFLPLVFVEGEIGFLFKDVAMTVCFSVFSSLIAALTLVPCLSSLKRSQTKKFGAVAPIPESTMSSSDGHHRGTAIPSVNSSNWKNFLPNLFRIYLTAIFRSVEYFTSLLGQLNFQKLKPFKSAFFKVHDTILLLFQRFMISMEGLIEKYLPQFINNLPKSAALFGIGTIAGIMIISQLGAELFPEEKIDKVEFNLSLDRSLTPEAAIVQIKSIESSLKDLKEAQEIFLLTDTLETNQFRLILKTQKNHLEHLQKTTNELLAKVPDLMFERIKASVFKDEKPFQLNIFHEDIRQLADQTSRVSQSLKNLSGIIDLSTSMDRWNDLVEIKFDPLKLGRLQTESGSFVQTLQNFYITREVPKFRVDKDSQILKIRTFGFKPQTSEDLRETSINTEAGSRIYLEQVSEIFKTKSPAEILHLNRNRIANISGNLGDWDLEEAARQTVKALKDKKIDWSFGGQQEQRKESNRNLMVALLLSIVLIYLIAASQFESLKLPFVVLLAVPLSVFGVAVFLILFGLNFSSLVLVGLIILAGSSVNTSLVMIDTAEGFAREGLSPFKSILEATKKRMRPIFVTTAANILGLIPMAFTFGEPGSSMQQPLAVTLIGGLVSSTLLTIIIVPSFYVWSQSRKGERP